MGESPPGESPSHGAATTQPRGHKEGVAPELPLGHGETAVSPEASPEGRDDAVPGPSRRARSRMLSKQNVAYSRHLAPPSRNRRWVSPPCRDPTRLGPVLTQAEGGSFLEFYRWPWCSRGGPCARPWRVWPSAVGTLLDTLTRRPVGFRLPAPVPRWPPPRFIRLAPCPVGRAEEAGGSLGECTTEAG